MELGFIRRGGEFFGADGNVYASVVEGGPLRDENAVPPDDREDCVWVSVQDAPAEVRRRLDPAYYGPVSSLVRAD